MKRREFIRFVGGARVGACGARRASACRAIGVLMPIGWSACRNVEIDFVRSAGDGRRQE